MKPVFVDTFFFLASLNKSDICHDRAIAWLDAYDGPLLTTAWIVTEVADALAGVDHRHGFGGFYQALIEDERMSLIPADRALWERGLALYLERRDKEWSLTDCISFTVMNERGLTEALTGDRHFQQAGFTVLLRDSSA